ncbi:MAG: isoaspartyl peptidase/L-asparaginase [Planctomycetota bacterium]|jgi:N4-(beta-N-acetylglucosaminyl)-L-asparaginase
MERRAFLRRGVLGLGALAGVRATAPAHGAAPPRREQQEETPMEQQPGEPIVVSTWNFGMAANAVAAQILQVGGDPMEAAVRGVMVPEADPEVSSVGLGGFPNAEGVMELDGAVMDGNTLEVGAVAGLQGILHPVAVAERVMSRTRHTLLVGEGARKFALSQGFKEAELLTDHAREQFRKRQAGKEHSPAGGGADPDDHDTIGLIVLHPTAGMRAVCSTSGAAWKLPGRVGDSPIVGHGLYCDSSVGGVVGTGLGEEFAKICAAHAVIERMRAGVEPEAAIREVIGRAVARDERNRERLLAMVALRRDGVIGAASSTPGFQIAVSRGTRHELRDVPPMYSKKS